MRKIVVCIFNALLVFSGCTSTGVKPGSSSAPVNQTEFNEVWVYVMKGEESTYTKEIPVTDIGYFIQAVNVYSELTDVPEKPEVFNQNGVRTHLVSSVDSRAQTHLLIDPSLPLRKKIIDQLAAGAKTYDGLQIDWELVMHKDRENFISFLKELREKLDGKTLSVAVPARLKKINSDAYDYEAISEVADRIVIMAYDEHWSTSTPGAVASFEWCSGICDYSVPLIPPEKLIMGLPFYGRTWRDDTEGGKAYRFNDIIKLIEQNDIDVERDSGNILNFKYKKEMVITGWFDDALSLSTKFNMYNAKGVKNIAFWRLIQSDPAVWNYIKISGK